jgi:hypothetical protein
MWSLKPYAGKLFLENKTFFDIRPRDDLSFFDDSIYENIETTRDTLVYVVYIHDSQEKQKRLQQLLVASARAYRRGGSRFVTCYSNNDMFAGRAMNVRIVYCSKSKVAKAIEHALHHSVSDKASAFIVDATNVGSENEIKNLLKTQMVDTNFGKTHISQLFELACVLTNSGDQRPLTRDASPFRESTPSSTGSLSDSDADQVPQYADFDANNSTDEIITKIFSCQKNDTDTGAVSVEFSFEDTAQNTEALTVHDIDTLLGALDATPNPIVHLPTFGDNECVSYTPYATPYQEHIRYTSTDVAKQQPSYPNRVATFIFSHTDYQTYTVKRMHTHDKKICGEFTLTTRFNPRDTTHDYILLLDNDDTINTFLGTTSRILVALLSKSLESRAPEIIEKTADNFELYLIELNTLDGTPDLTKVNATITIKGEFPTCLLTHHVA